MNGWQAKQMTARPGTGPRRWALATMLAGLVLLPVAMAVADSPSHGQTVQMVVDYNNGVKKHFTAIAWRRGMTVLDALNQAKAFKPGLTYKVKGTGASTFLLSIDGVANESDLAQKNWLYWVNDGFGDRSIGVRELAVGDVIIFRFDTWKTDG
jgi:hypothetical protein